jgi:hypothetical protein
MKRLVLCSLLLGGCFGPYLRWNAMPPAPMVAGKAEIVVADHREPKKGGLDPTHIGNERNGFGIPFPIRLGSTVDAGMTVREVIAQALLAAGVGVAPLGDMQISSRVQIEVQQMWCDGYMGYKANLLAIVSVLGPDNSVRVAPTPIAAEEGGFNCQAAYERALTKVGAAAVAVFSQPAVQAAAVGAAPPPPPPPPAQ